MEVQVLSSAPWTFRIQSGKKKLILPTSEPSQTPRIQKRPASGVAVRAIQERGRCASYTFCRKLWLKLRDQPRLSHPPVAFGGVYRNIEDRGRFFDAQSAEVTKFHYAAFAGVDSCQFVERAVERQ